MFSLKPLNVKDRHLKQREVIRMRFRYFFGLFFKTCLVTCSSLQDPQSYLFLKKIAMAPLDFAGKFLLDLSITKQSKLIYAMLRVFRNVWFEKASKSKFSNTLRQLIYCDLLRKNTFRILKWNCRQEIYKLQS